MTVLDVGSSVTVLDVGSSVTVLDVGSSVTSRRRFVRDFSTSVCS